MQHEDTRRHIHRTVAAAAVAVLAVAGTLTPAQAASRTLTTQTVAIDSVEVTVAGTVDASRVTFSVELDTHSGDLTNDLSKSRLIAAGANFTKGTWRGDPAGGHHRSGTLTFSGRTKAVGAMTLRLSGWTKALNVRWNAKGKPVR